MRGLGLARAPRWVAVVLVFLLLADGAVLLLLRQRQLSLEASPTGEYASAVAAASGGPAAPAAAPSAAAAQVATTDAPVLAVYGDGYAAGNDQGGIGPAGWPALVAASAGAALSLHAVPQAGYASIGVTGQDFVGLVTAAPVADATVTLVVGSRNDRTQDPTVVSAHAAQVVDDVRAASPASVIVLIGPIWSNGAPPADVLANRDAVEEAANTAGVEFVDPLTAGWFAEPAGLISSDGVSPTDAGHAALAALIEPVVSAALAQAAPSAILGN
jgi:hypothetical protein